MTDENTQADQSDPLPEELKEGNEEEPVEIDEMKLNQLIERRKDEQSLGGGVVAGIVAAALGAAIWAGITVALERQIGFMAIGIGFLVGFAVRKFGKGMDSVFGVAGGALAVLGCLAGNLLTSCIFIAQAQEMPVLVILSQINPAIAVEIMRLTFSPIDVLFYAFAVYYGYKLSFHPLTGEELATVVKQR
ncbi:MAG: hypothetical protein O7F56_06900 [Acidobacteria bacterium]|nr:hypothetical protein [Acidobacteriota bacterium]